MHTPHNAPRAEAAISSAEYDVAVVRPIAERLRARLTSDAEGVVAIGGGTPAPSAETGDASGSAPWSDARVVVVLHERLWGRTPATEREAALIAARREREGTAFLRVVRLDETPLPAWCRGVKSRTLGDDVDAVVEWVLDAVRACGGEVRAEPAPARAGAGAGETTDAARGADPRGAFLDSSRAHAVCARELERLADGIARRAASIDAGQGGARAEVRRSPGRCIVQLGPVALTVSWVRDHVDTVSAGRLLIDEWEGTVARTTSWSPERASRPARTATLVREAVLVADATGEPDWLWRREASAPVGYASRELAAMCVDSLVLALAEHEA